MPVGERELLYRRFDPRDESHWLFDEGGGEGRLRSGALRWDAHTENGQSMKACSVYQRSVLWRNALRPAACLEARGWRLAGVVASDVRNLKRENLPGSKSPFDAVEDPYPSGVEDAHPRDAAHALIVHNFPGRGLNGWYRELARAFSVVPT